MIALILAIAAGILLAAGFRKLFPILCLLLVLGAIWQMIQPLMPVLLGIGITLALIWLISAWTKVWREEWVEGRAERVQKRAQKRAQKRLREEGWLTYAIKNIFSIGGSE